MLDSIRTGGADFNRFEQYIYLENTFVCREREAYLDIDDIRIVYDFDLECIIGWYRPNAE